jgi:hypothetical protein
VLYWLAHESVVDDDLVGGGRPKVSGRYISSARVGEDDIDIGAVEGAVRYLVGMRSMVRACAAVVDRAEHVPHLRCVLLNGQWDEFVEHLADRQPGLAAAPIPTRTHDARPKAA